MSRPRCVRCRRLQAQCLCASLVTLSSRVRVLFLQHPLERDHPKNTAQLTQACLPNSRLEVGERFDPDQLQAWLKPQPSVQSLLLYPPNAAGGGQAIAAETCRRQAEPEHWQLVVLDGTWKKTVRMLYRNPALQALPRLALPVSSSDYWVRKARGPHQLSTLEATQLALGELEARPDDYAGLTQVLAALQAQLQTRLPTVFSD
ncbi:tRNA-uridine aminocarboxypropyltransferase [Hydrogenovibrio halophilus]|uniref:tRNA-uridine aminocarboxypropyltransferase n=1 Tax=Hydrogenovibrio halophilus TaxID=373391 RepID=UPI000527F7EB|nr:tRNA-uridine aminocarboxypropyltransferase [Hydrogenovibrio halophilus]